MPPLVRVAGVVTVAAIVLLWFAASESRVEAWYVEGIGPWIAGVPNLLFRSLPFSVMEPVVVLAVLLALVWLVRQARRAIRREAPVRTVLGEVVGTAYVATVALGIAFYLVWGLAYARPVVEYRQAWRVPGEGAVHIPPWELEALALPLVEGVNALYLEIHGVPDAFVVTGSAESAMPFDRARVDAAIDRGWPGVVRDLELHASVARGHGPVKPLASSGLFSWLRIGGVYFPFTAEANVNTWPPTWQQPFTMAHEKAHQRFLASENEANFHGMLACMHSDDPLVRYSGWLFAQRQVLRALQRSDPFAFVRLIGRRLPGVQRDVDASYAFWLGYQGALSDLSHLVNDAYLRANAVRGGVGSYGRSLELLVLYARARGWPAELVSAPEGMEAGLEVR